MGRNKKEVELVSSQVEDAILNKEEIVKEETIFDKYRSLINQANSNYLRNYQYADLMVMLRYTEKFYGHSLPLNLQCSSCIIELVQMFGRLEQK